MIVDESLTRIAELIRSGSVSPVEVAEAHLDQIAKLNPQLNAIVTVAPDLLEKAREAEAAIKRGDQAWTTSRCSGNY